MASKEEQVKEAYDKGVWDTLNANQEQMTPNEIQIIKDKYKLSLKQRIEGLEDG